MTLLNHVDFLFSALFSVKRVRIRDRGPCYVTLIRAREQSRGNVQCNFTLSVFYD